MYTAASSTLTFAAGTATLTQTVTVQVSGDTTVEANETFTVDLSNPSANVPVIDVQGNGLSIASGDTVPSLADGTNFGGVEVAGGSLVHTFTVENEASVGSGGLLCDVGKRSVAVIAEHVIRSESRHV